MPWQPLLARAESFVQDEVHAAVDRLEAANAYPQSLVDSMRAFGAFGLNVPTRYGGLEAPPSVQVAFMRTLSRGWLSLCAMVASHARVCSYITAFGTEAQKEQLLPLLASGELIAAHGHTERSGKDWQHLKTEVSRDAGAHVVNGEKAYVTNAANAGLIAVTAKCSLPDIAPEGFVTVLLRQGHQGLKVGPDLPRLGVKGVSLCPVFLERAPISPEVDLLGGGIGARQAAGLATVPKLLDVAARAVGVAEVLVARMQSCLNEDRAPRPKLRDFQLAKYRLASVASQARVAALALTRLADQADQGECPLEDAYALQAFATGMVLQASQEAMLLLGGRGYADENGFLARSLRDVPSLAIIGSPRDKIFDALADLLLDR